MLILKINNCTNCSIVRLVAIKWMQYFVGEPSVSKTVTYWLWTHTHKKLPCEKTHLSDWKHPECSWQRPERCLLCK